MKNVLIIAYYFPPSGGPGVQRVLKHIKYLPEFNWNPIVLTVENGQYPAIDESLLDQIPPKTIIYRSHIFEPHDLYRFFTGKKKETAIDVNVIKKEGQKLSVREKISEFIRATFFIPDGRAFWIYSSKKVVHEILEKHKIDMIYSSSPPYTCSLIARNIKRNSSIPWVAGFRDPWTDFISAPKRWFIPKAIDKAMEFSVFNEADAIEVAWEGIMKDALKKYPKIDQNKFFHIPNGFDSDDYPKLNYQKNDRFTITYTGSMYGRRNPLSFLTALKNLIYSNSIKSKQIKIRFIGRFGTEVEAMFEQFPYKDCLEILPYIPHNKSIEYLLRSDALLLIVDESKESQEIVPGKVYEYLGTKRPIIAIAPQESAISKLLNECGSGYIAHQSEIEKIEHIIKTLYIYWKNDFKGFNPNLHNIYKYERKNATKELSNLFNAIIQKQL